MDIYQGSGQWFFSNAAFPAEVVGGTLTVAGSPVSALNGTFSITTRPSANQIITDPAPAVAAGPVGATSISFTYTPAEVVSAGPEIVGVALIPVAKDGMDKLPSTKRAT